MNTQNASDELRTLTGIEIGAVSGAAKELIDMGLFGHLVVGGNNGCATWTTTEFGDGGSLTTKITACPK